MAHKTKSSLLLLLVILGINLLAVAHEAAPKADEKQPEWLIDGHDRSVLIPGLGRYMLPPLHGHGHGLKNYNPITGTYGPPGGGGGGGGAGVGSPHGYVPGGDDTFVPNPGVEVPIPGSGTGRP